MGCGREQAGGLGEDEGGHLTSILAHPCQVDAHDASGAYPGNCNMGLREPRLP